MPPTRTSALARRPRAAGTFALGAGLTALGLATCAVVLVRGTRTVHLSDAADAGRITILHQRLTYPLMNLAGAVELLLAAAGLLAVLLTLRAAIREMIASRRVVADLDARRAGLCADGVRVFVDERRHAFCAGLLRPKVYLSTGARDALEPVQLAAVLAHEQRHRERYDPLRNAAGRALGHGLFFLPALPRLAARYEALAELEADAAAVEASGGDRAPLASAMLAFTAGEAPASTVGIAPERVDHLMGRPVNWNVPVIAVAVSVATLVLIAATAWLLGRLATAHATLALPFISAQPCVIVLAMMPGILVLLGTSSISRGTQRHRRALSATPD